MTTVGRIGKGGNGLSSGWCALALLGALSVTTGCVSSTLETVEVEPARELTTTPLALTDDDAEARLARSDAVAQIRAKADGVPVNEQAPAIGVPRHGDGPAMTSDQINTNQLLLRQAAEDAGETIPDDELLAKQRSIAELRRRAHSHFDDALREIEQ